MTTRIGINGFGRIGRLILRSIKHCHDEKLEVVVVNDLADTETNAHLLKWDSTYGRYPGEVSAKDSAIIVDGKEIKAISETDPTNIKWRDYGVEIVIESTGRFTDAQKAAAHLKVIKGWRKLPYQFTGFRCTVHIEGYDNFPRRVPRRRHRSFFFHVPTFLPFQEARSRRQEARISLICATFLFIPVLCSLPPCPTNHALRQPVRAGLPALPFPGSHAVRRQFGELFAVLQS